MNASISTFGHVCLCEWSGPVTVTMVVSLLSQLQRGPAASDKTSVAALPVALPRRIPGWSHPATCNTQPVVPVKLPSDETLLILNLHPSSARCILSRASTFPDVLPALWAYCQEIIIACQGEEGLIDHLRRALCGSASTPISTLARPLVFFELLDEAFDHAQGVYPHEVLELRRQRIRSGTWGACVNDEQSTSKRGNTNLPGS